MPIKRSEELQPLSRQHHNGLLFCLLLHKGIKKKADPEVMKEFIVWFWYKDLLQHFHLEEKFLLPLQHEYFLLEPGLQRMVDEHYELKNIINENSLNPTYDSVEDLRAKLEAHIRFEERDLFPLIEETISDRLRQAIGSVLAQEKDDNCMNYPIKFWE